MLITLRALYVFVKIDNHAFTSLLFGCLNS